MRVKHWEHLKPENRNNFISIYLSGVTLMRFRETAMDACDPKLIDDDTVWKQRVADEIGCIPPYWNNKTKDHNELKQTCKSEKELEVVEGYWPLHDSILDTNKIFKNYTKPCNSYQQFIFNKVENDYSKQPDILKIKISLQNEFYQEILNTRAFGVTDLWASIGGYVGIFCGYSLLQTSWYFIESLKRCINLGWKIWNKE